MVSNHQTTDRAAELRSMPYEDYLETPEWRTVRRLKLAQARHCCQLCNADDRPLHVHHRTYDRRGQERLDDLLVLCEECHGRFHDAEDADGRATGPAMSDRDVEALDPRYRRMREIDRELDDAEHDRAVELVEEKAEIAKELREDGVSLSFAHGQSVAGGAG